MAGTNKKTQALEAQAQKIKSVFSGAGYELVDPPILQPADIFLDVIGEGLRGRTYVFTDPDGAELCLRPDLTVPTCLLYLDRHPQADTRARYCYYGSTFRFQPTGAPPAHPREFRQAGVESFGATDPEKAEADVVGIILEALKAGGLGAHRLRIGDLGLLHALLSALSLPERWQRRLTGQLRRPEAFRAELRRLVAGGAKVPVAGPAELVRSIDPEDAEGAQRLVGEHLDQGGIELVGTRTLAEITETLIEAAADARAEPLAAETADLIDRYLSITAPSRAAVARLKDLGRERNVEIGDAVEAFKRRLDLLTQAGVDAAHAEFSAEFGRNLDYYTGFVFEIIVPELGPASPVAGGGRYDSLLEEVGAPHEVPAVGAMIHTERLHDVVAGGGSE